MKIVRILLGAIASFALANNIYAANKTHVTDTFGAGNGRVDISYDFGSGSLPGTLAFAGGPSIPADSKVSGSSLAAAFYYGVTDRLDVGISLQVQQYYLPLNGVTDRLDVGISLPFIDNTKVTFTLTDFVDTETLTTKNEGRGDIVIRARYLRALL